MPTKQFTISIPVFERYDYFEEAIHSALNQSVKCRIIVVDNDSSHDKFRDFVANLDNPFVSYYRNEKNLGMVNNWNKCIELAKTPWVSILHDDDTLHPRFIESLAKVAKHSPDIGLMAVKVRVGSYVPPGFADSEIKEMPALQFIRKAYFLYRNLSPFPGIAFKKSLAEKTGYFEPALHPVADIYFWYKLAGITRAAIIGDHLAFYRISQKQETVPNVRKLIEMNKEFVQMVLDDLGDRSLLTKFSALWARQQHINYYKRTYPGTSIEDLKFGNMLNNSNLARVMNRIRDTKSYVHSEG